MLYAAIIGWSGIPETYLDLGSGTGAMVNMARKIGTDAYGVDLIARGPGREDWFITHDLTKPLDLGRQFDLVTCLEVAEHIPEPYAPILIETIGRHLKTGGILVFSAAAPGQRGEHHANTQPSWVWRDLFYDVGVSYRQDYTHQLQHIWAYTAGPLMWLGSNLQVFDS